MARKLPLVALLALVGAEPLGSINRIRNMPGAFSGVGVCRLYVSEALSLRAAGKSRHFARGTPQALAGAERGSGSDAQEAGFHLQKAELPGPVLAFRGAGRPRPAGGGSGR